MDDRDPITGAGLDDAVQAHRDPSTLGEAGADQRDLTAERRDELSALRDEMADKRDREQATADRKQAADDRRQAGTDELTGARRRGVGLEDLEREMKRARREGTGLVAAFVDVDGLKVVNDTHGHAAGDDVLRAVAQRLRARMRAYDLLVRMGGDEFLCALPNITVTEARERVRDLTGGAGGGQTVSFGFGELLDEDTPEDLVRRADTDLLESRRG